MVAVNHDLAARYADIDAHIELLALVVVLVRHLDTTRQDMICFNSSSFATLSRMRVSTPLNGQHHEW